MKGLHKFTYLDALVWLMLLLATSSVLKKKPTLHSSEFDHHSFRGPAAPQGPPSPTGYGGGPAGPLGPSGAAGLTGDYGAGNRHFEESADMELSVEDVMSVILGIEKAIADVGGGSYVESKEVGTDRGARLTVRVPSAKITVFIASVKTLPGVKVDRLSFSRQDITAEVVDNRAYIETLRKTETRLDTLADKTTDPKVILNVHSKALEISRDLDRAIARNNSYARRTAYAKLVITIHKRRLPVTRVPPPGYLLSKWNLLAKTFAGFGDSMVNMAITNAPFGVIVGVTTLWLWSRYLRG
jgi:hypothetical protein